jgi:hypothetical protein
VTDLHRSRVDDEVFDHADPASFSGHDGPSARIRVALVDVVAAKLTERPEMFTKVEVL